MNITLNKKLYFIILLLLILLLIIGLLNVRILSFNSKTKEDRFFEFSSIINSNEFDYNGFDKGISLYPKSIPIIKIRKDSDGNDVERGRLQLLGGVSSYTSDIKNIDKWGDNTNNNKNKHRVSYKEFKEKLQCVENEPSIDTKQGILSLGRLVPVTKHTVEIMCAYVETNCDGWKKCNDKINILKNITYDDDDEFFDDTIRLLRVIKGKLYFDWPWGILRFYHRPVDYYTVRLFSAVLEMVNNIPDSVFFLKNHDTPLLPANFPFPSFSHTPTLQHSDIPYPWVRAIAYEILYHNEAIVKKNYIFYANDPDDDDIWNNKDTKAGWFGALWGSPGAVSRQIILDLQRIRPDLIDAGWTHSWYARPWNPASNEITSWGVTNISIHQENRTKETDEKYNKPGYLYSLIDQQVKKVHFAKYMANYKYLIVVGGQNGVDRLATFLSHSGAVILLQESEILQHFSTRIKPWVHYVPISFTAADLIEKIEWLNKNQKLARRIAKNGNNFAKSYLRLEDYYCYTAYAMHAISTIETSESLQPFNATWVNKIKPNSQELRIIQN